MSYSCLTVVFLIAHAADLADMFENFMAVGPSGKKVAVYMDLMVRSGRNAALHWLGRDGSAQEHMPLF